MKYTFELKEVQYTSSGKKSEFFSSEIQKTPPS